MYKINHNTPFLKRWKNKFQYFSDNCTLRGIGHVCSAYNISLFKRLFWLCTITACCVSSAFVLLGVMSLYTSDGVSYSVETDYLEWDTPFPALTVCQQSDQDRVTKYLAENNLSLNLKTFAKEISFWNSKYCRSCASCKMNVTCLENFHDLIQGIRMKCTELLTDCWWNDEQFPCCERFHPLPTESGICYSFNSRIAGDGNVILVNRYTDLPSLVFTAVDKIDVSVHSPYETINVQDQVSKRRCYNVPLVSDFEAIVKAEETVNDVSVLPLPSESRHCLFSHERPEFAQLWPFKWYSYSACQLYCRAMLQVEVCNCTHHFMPVLVGIPQCDINGLTCLFHSKKLSGNDDCNCPMACDEVEYKMTYLNCPRYYNEEYQEMLPRGTRGRLLMGQLPTLRVRRHAIRDILGLVVDIASVIGVFFGASLLSFIEIFYIFFIRKYN